MKAFYDCAKCQKSIGPRAFWSIEKGWSKYLIKPVEFRSFWSPKRKMAPKMIKKALGFSLKVYGVSRLRKMSKSIGPRPFWSMQKSLSKYLIKPVKFGTFWSQYRKMGSEMIKKALGFHSKLMAFYDFAKWWKALVLEHSGASKKVYQNTL